MKFFCFFLFTKRRLFAFLSLALHVSGFTPAALPHPVSCQEKAAPEVSGTALVQDRMCDQRSGGA